MIATTEITNGQQISATDRDIRESLMQIKRYMENTIDDLKRKLDKKDSHIHYLQDALDKSRQQVEGNAQLVNKLLGELSKLQNDIEWYKRTYERRSLLGTIREKLLRSH